MNISILFCKENKINEMKKVLIAVTGILFLTACAAPKNVESSKKNKNMHSVFEIAINQANDKGWEHFLTTREKFVEVLGQEEATLNEGKWKPIFAVNPDYRLDEILIGMTEWNSFEGVGESAQRLMPQDVTRNYFASFDPLAYAILETKDGKPFDFESIKQEGQVVEFAIRKGKSPDAFGPKRDAFFASLDQHDGFRFAREFKVYELNEQGIPTLAENTQAVIIVWENIEKFQAAAQPVFASQAYADFASLIDVKTYFASIPQL